MWSVFHYQSYLLIVCHSQVVPIFIQQANPSQKVQKRLMATKLLEKLVRIVSPYEYDHYSLPFQWICSVFVMNSRSQFNNCQWMIMEQWGLQWHNDWLLWLRDWSEFIFILIVDLWSFISKCSDVSRIVLPCLVSLAEDDDANVREAALPSLVALIHRITRGIYSFLPFISNLLKYRHETIGRHSFLP